MPSPDKRTKSTSEPKRDSTPYAGTSHLSEKKQRNEQTHMDTLQKKNKKRNEPMQRNSPIQLTALTTHDKAYISMCAL